MENLELLKKLEDLGVTFCIATPSPGGSETHTVKPKELLRLIEDPVSVFASLYGVSKADYMAWSDEDFSVRCAGKTSKGKQCKNIVPGGSCVSPGKWVELHGEYCALHAVGYKP